MSRVLRITLLVLLLIGMGTSSNLAKAQDENWELRINQFSTLEGPDAMTLKLYFNIYDDRTGTPMLNVDAQSAQVTLLNTGYTSDGELKKPDVPIYITLVMDSSGSMGGAAQDLREAAKLSLNNSPDNSLFSVVQFDEDIVLLQDFTENIPALTFAIDRYQVSRKGTCLYDATYTAVEAMSKAPAGRRAVILFTDGKDENAAGQVCSKHTYQELVDLAMQTQVPISTIGLSYQAGAINAVELDSMAGSTGGVHAVANQNDLPLAFEKIMLALKAQWMLEVPLYPRRGNNDAVFNLTLTENNLSLNTAFNLNSNTDYPGPPSPVNVNFAGLVLSAAEQSYEVQVNMTAPELAAYVKIEVWDQDAGSKVGEFIFNDPVANNQFFIPTESLIIGRSYELRISAISREDQTPFPIVRDDRGNVSTQLIHEFGFDPTASYPSLEIQSLVQNSGDLELTVTVTNPELIGGFDGWLVDEATNTKVLNSDFTAAPITTTTGKITVPLRTKGISDGQYTVIVRVLAKNNNVYSSRTYEGVAYNAPSLFQRLGVALIAAPIIMIAILGVIVAVVGFLMFNSSRQKSLSGTPVLQGRLGGKMSGGKQSGPVIAVADDEPLRPQSKPAASTPARSSTPASAPYTPPSAPVSTPAPSADATMVANNFEAGNATVIASAANFMPRAALTVLSSASTAAPRGPVTVSPLPFIIGRSEGALVIQDSNISRKHAQITYNDQQQAYFITDLNSSNGTRVNNQRIAPNQPTRLENGIVLGLGPHTTLRFDVN